MSVAGVQDYASAGEVELGSVLAPAQQVERETHRSLPGGGFYSAIWLAPSTASTT